MVKLVLVGIYRKESPIIGRLIRSCSSIIDGICATNTEGIRDDMTEVIEKEGKELGIPTKVFHEPWKNFGINRTSSFRNFQEFVKEQNWDPTTVYSLLLDADMCLEIKPSFNKHKLKEAGYQLIQKNPSIEYYNMRLLRADVNFYCRGCTHEYWEQDGSNGVKSLPVGQTRDLEISDKNDGCFKEMKYKRDIALLTQGLIDEPGNVRYLFYLAQSYKDTGKFKEAIKYYKKRVEGGGWREEVWYSKFMIGGCYILMDKFSKAVEAYLDAYEYYPGRAENLHALSNQYRLKGKNQLAYMFAKKGLEIPYPKEDVLFIAKPVYDYQLKVEISIVAYYIQGKRLEGMLACNDLFLDKAVPDDTKSMVHRNIAHYIDPLKIVQKIPVNINLPLLNEKKPHLGTYRPMNPSIIATKQGYLMNVRCVSYRQKSGVYEYPDGTGQIRTKNIFVKLDKNLKPIEEHELIDPNTRDCSNTVFGLEDIRLFEWKDNNVWFTCSTRMTADTPQIALCSVSNYPMNDKYNVTSKRLLIGPKGENSCEKNWMPMVSNNHLYLIYSHDPLIKLHYNDNNPKGVDTSDAVSLPWNLSSLRGSGILLPYEEGFLSVVHEVVVNDKRIYVHRFITYDKKLIPKKLSFPFYFFDKDVEYVCSFCFDHGRKNLILGLGVSDGDANLIKVSMDTVKSMLMDLPNKA